MTALQLPRAFGSTSGARRVAATPARNPTVVGVMIHELGTSVGRALFADAATQLRSVEHTTAGASVVAPRRAGPGIAELRRLSGLSWDQLARLFGVSRRALHFWGAGKAMTPSNEEHLHRLLVVIRAIDRGAASVNRTALISANEDGTIALDLLVARKYEEVLARLGRGGVTRLQPRKLSKEAMAARAPRPPWELVGALQDRVHVDEGVGRAAKSVKVRSDR